MDPGCTPACACLGYVHASSTSRPTPSLLVLGRGEGPAPTAPQGTLWVTPTEDVPTDWLGDAQRELYDLAGLSVLVHPEGLPIHMLAPEDHDPEWYGGLHWGVMGLDEETLLTSACSPAGVVAHELAHAYGASHVKAKHGGSRMQPFISGCEPWSEADLDELLQGAYP